MRQKMITLCPTTWEYASKMKNFSGWVRKQLEEHAKAEVIDRKSTRLNSSHGYISYAVFCLKKKKKKQMTKKKKTNQYQEPWE